MREFLAMGGYAFYVWGAWLCTAALLIGHWVAARRALAAEQRAAVARRDAASDGAAQRDAQRGGAGESA